MPIFRENRPLPSWLLRMGPIGRLTVTTPRFVISVKSEDLKYSAAEVCALATVRLLGLRFSCTYLLYGMQQNATTVDMPAVLCRYRPLKNAKFFLHLQRVFAILSIFKEVSWIYGTFVEASFQQKSSGDSQGSDRFKKKVVTLLHLKNLISVRLLSLHLNFSRTSVK